MPELTPEQLTQLRVATERLLELSEAAKWDARGHERRTDEVKVKRAVFGLLNAANKAIGIRAMADLVRQAEASADAEGELPVYAESVVYAALMREITPSLLAEHIPRVVEALGQAALRSENAERTLLGLEPIESLTKGEFDYTGTAFQFQQAYPELAGGVETFMVDSVGNHATVVSHRIVGAANPASPIGIGPLQRQLRGDVSDLTVKRATTITRTETARVYGATARGTFKKNGLTRVRLVTAGNPCPDCEAIAARGFMKLDDIADLPIHPNCRCDYIPDVEGWLPPSTRVADPTAPLGPGEFRRVDPGYDFSQGIPKATARRNKAFEEWTAREKFPGKSAFTDPEVTSLKAYKKNSNMVNNALRADPGDVKYAIEQLDSAMAKHQLSENTILFRGVKQIDFIKNGLYHEQGFLSTSMDQGTAMGFTGKTKLTQVLELRVPKGTKALRMNEFGAAKTAGEREVLLQRNTVWRVVSIEDTEVGGLPIRRIVMEMVVTG